MANELPVEAFAQGFLSLIGSKNRGVGINLAADALRPTVELTPFLGANVREGAQVTVAAMTAAAAFHVTVPQGEIWRLIGVSALFDPPGGSTVSNARLILRTPEIPGVNNFIILPPSGQTLAAGVSGLLTYFPLGQLLLTGGCQLGTAAAAVGVNVVLTFSALYERMRA